MADQFSAARIAAGAAAMTMFAVSITFAADEL